MSGDERETDVVPTGSSDTTPSSGTAGTSDTTEAAASRDPERPEPHESGTEWVRTGPPTDGPATTQRVQTGSPTPGAWTPTAPHAAGPQYGYPTPPPGGPRYGQPTPGPWAATAPPGAWGPASYGGPPTPGMPPYGAPPPGYGGPPPPGTGWGPPPGAGAPPGRRPRRTKVLIGVAGAVVLLLVAALVLVVATRPSSPQATLEETVADVRGWSGATYGFRIPDGFGGQAAVEITVDRLGNTVGSVTRASGGRAEFVTVGDERAIRADRAWWQRSADRPELVDRLSGVWLSGASAALPSELGTWNETPSDLADRITPVGAREEDGQVVDGRDARVFTSGGQRTTVIDDDPPRLVGVDGTVGVGNGRVSPVTTRVGDPAALGALNSLSAEVPGFKYYLTAVTERPRLTVTVEGAEGTCDTPTCTVIIRLVNTGTLSTAGRILVTLNGAPVATHPFSSAPGSNLTFPTTADNPVYTTPGARIAAYWLARIEGGN